MPLMAIGECKFILVKRCLNHNAPNTLIQPSTLNFTSLNLTPGLFYSSRNNQPLLLISFITHTYFHYSIPSTPSLTIRFFSFVPISPTGVRSQHQRLHIPPQIHLDLFRLGQTERTRASNCLGMADQGGCTNEFNCCQSIVRIDDDCTTKRSRICHCLSTRPHCNNYHNYWYHH